MTKCRECKFWNRDHKRTGLCCKPSQMEKSPSVNGVSSMIPKITKDVYGCKEGIPREGK
jgi:hypothetical protein